MKILIAEDDLVTRELLKRILSHMADEIVEAGDGLEALEMLETEDPDFLFTDLQMPELDGHALLEAVRSSPKHAQLPVVCMSAVKDKDEVTALLALGIQDYILKPIRPAEVHERFRKVIAQHSGWRRRQGAEGGKSLLLVDPDPEFREFVKPFLDGHFTLTEAVSGAHALRLFKDAEVKPNYVLTAKDLPLVSETQLVSLLTKMSADFRVPAPAFWLCADDEEIDDKRAPFFEGRIRRTFVPDAFTAELRRTLITERSASERLRAHFEDGARRWSLTATRQALGVMSGQEVTTIAAKHAEPIVDGVAGRIQLTGPDVRVHVLIACPREHAMALASKVLRREVSFENGAADVVGELSNTLGGRARAALLEQGHDLQLSLPEILTDYAIDPSARWDLADWFETMGKQRFFVAFAVDEFTGAGGSASKSAVAEPATAGA